MQIVAGVAVACPAISAPIVVVPPGMQGGITSTHIETYDLPNNPFHGVRATATADVIAYADNVHASVNSPVMARGHHLVCFDTWFTTEANYMMVLDVGGKQTKISEHIVIPAHKRTCISHGTYMQVSFPSAGNYMYSASTSGSTQMAGTKMSRSNAIITVS